MPLLSKDEIARTRTAQMLRVDAGQPPPFDFWPYVLQIPAADFQGFDCSAEIIEWVWRSDDAAFEHVLISTKEDRDVVMVIVLDLNQRTVHGHFLLDLKREYGLR
jgi:hypothetical protein